jgi:hypothetical protein
VFYWPHCELTEYELQFVALYKEEKKGGKPGVLRRAYRGLLNTLADPNVPELEVPHTTANIQISRRSRVFALSFAGDTSCWRLNIESASGERFTPVNPGAPQTPSTYDGADPSQAPIVASMCPGSFYSPASFIGRPGMGVPATEVGAFVTNNEFRLPLIVEPNWELVSNETLIFTGTPMQSPLVTGQLVLEIMVHVWEFPEWQGC